MAANVSLLQEELFNMKIIPSASLVEALNAITERDEDGVEKALLVADVLCNANVYVGGGGGGGGGGGVYILVPEGLGSRPLSS